MNNQTLMVDMDDVITHGGLLYLINDFLGTNYAESDFTDFYMQNIIPNKEDFFKYFITKNLYDYCTLAPNAYEILEQLNNKYEVFIGTSYIYPEIKKDSGIILLHKYNYLYENLPFINPKNYVFLGNKEILNCDIKIDDKIENLKNARTKLLYSAYHNKDINEKVLTNNNIKRVDNWNDIKIKLLK